MTPVTRMLHYLRHTRSCACAPSGSAASRAFPGAWGAASRGGAVGGGAAGSSNQFALFMVSFFCVVLLALLVLLQLCSSMSGASFVEKALHAFTAVLLHGAVGTVVRRLFGRRPVVVLLLLILSRAQGACAMDSFGTPMQTSVNSFSGSAAAAFAAGSLGGMPLSVSPQRADPRPPTCASVGRDIAQIIQQVSHGGRLDASCTPSAERHGRLGCCTTLLAAVQVRQDFGSKRGKGLDDECLTEDTTSGGHVGITANCDRTHQPLS